MMKTLLKFTLLTLFTLIGCQTTAWAQNDTFDEVHLFQSFFTDATIANTTYAESFVRYQSPDLTDIGLRGGVPLTSNLELGTALIARDSDGHGSGVDVGLAEIPLYARYNIINNRTKFALGGFYFLPFGDVDQLNDFGVYGALRHPLSNQVVLTGNVGIDFREQFDDDYVTSVNFNPGIIYAASQQVHFLGELRIENEANNIGISGGVDYKLRGAGRLRGNIFVSDFNGESTDVELTIGFLFNI